MRIAIAVLVVLAATLLATTYFRPSDDLPSATVPMVQDVYVWQRDWTPAVPAAIVGQSKSFRRVVVLAAEITPRTGAVFTARPNYAAIAAAVPAVGLAVRIGPLPASASRAFSPDSPLTNLVRSRAVACVSAARSAGLGVVELQLDFDCPESKLLGYRDWVRVVKSAVFPVPVVVTALPSWLGRPEFASLAAEAGGFVMQVHSLHKPAGPDDNLSLCDPAEAARAVAAAAAVGVPFRVAVPTYSYVAGFAPDGSLLGLSAEGAAPQWPAGVTVKILRSDPAELADLVRDWSRHRPALMTGLIWYRLPVEGDQLNWPAATLTSVIGGRVPVAKLTGVAATSDVGLVEIFIRNDGDGSAEKPCRVTVTWGGKPAEAADGIGGFDCLENSAGGAIFRQSGPGRRIAPGEKFQIGWLRLPAGTEVRTDVTFLP